MESALFDTIILTPSSNNFTTNVGLKRCLAVVINSSAALYQAWLEATWCTTVAAVEEWVFLPQIPHRAGSIHGRVQKRPHREMWAVSAENCGRILPVSLSLESWRRYRSLSVECYVEFVFNVLSPLSGNCSGKDEYAHCLLTWEESHRSIVTVNTFACWCSECWLFFTCVCFLRKR